MRGARRGRKSMEGYKARKSLFPHVTSCHSARRRRAADKHVLALHPLCLLPAPVLSAAHRRIHPSTLFPGLRKCWPDQDQAQLSDQTRLMATRPRFQRAQTQIPECFLMSDASLSRSLSPRRTLSLPFPSSLMSHHETHRNFGLFRVSEP